MKLTGLVRAVSFSTNRSFSYTSLLQFASSYNLLWEHDNHNTFRCLGNLGETRERAHNKFFLKKSSCELVVHSNLRLQTVIGWCNMAFIKAFTDLFHQTCWRPGWRGWVRFTSTTAAAATSRTFIQQVHLLDVNVAQAFTVAKRNLRKVKANTNECVDWEKKEKWVFKHI